MMENYSITVKWISGIVDVVFTRIKFMQMDVLKTKFSTEEIVDFSMSCVRRKFEKSNYIKLLQNWLQNMEILQNISATQICCSQECIEQINDCTIESVICDLETKDIFNISANKPTTMDSSRKQTNFVSLDKTAFSWENSESSVNEMSQTLRKKSEWTDVTSVQGPTFGTGIMKKSTLDSENVVSHISKFLVKPSESISDEDWATSNEDDDDDDDWGEESDDDSVWGEESDDDSVWGKESNVGVTHEEANAFDPQNMFLSQKNPDLLSADCDASATSCADFKKDTSSVSKFFVRPSQSFRHEEEERSSDESTKCSDDENDDDEDNNWLLKEETIDKDSYYNEASDSRTVILFPRDPNFLSVDQNDNDSSGICVDEDDDEDEYDKDFKDSTNNSDNSDDDIIFCDDDDVSCQLEKASQLNTRAKKVKFSENVKFFEVDARWNAGELMDARCGPWETYARDRERFKMRVLAVEEKLNALFETEHRNKMRTIIQNFDLTN